MIFAVHLAGRDDVQPGFRLAGMGQHGLGHVLCFIRPVFRQGTPENKRQQVEEQRPGLLGLAAFTAFTQKQ